MTREPWGLYLFRLLISVAILCLLGMLYWSNALLEEQVQQLRHEVERIGKEGAGSHHAAASSPVLHTKFAPLQHVDPNLPNLLSDDPFYEKTLPTLLPPNFIPHGTRHVATVGRPDNLHPFSNWSNVVDWVSQCTVSVSTMHFGKYETMAPDMALKLEERPIPGTSHTEFWVHLRDGVMWAPLDSSMFPEGLTLAPHFLEEHPVTADDYKFYIDALMNPWVQAPGAVALRTYYGDLEEIRVIDPLTFVVRWKHERVTEPDGQTVEKIKYMAKSLTGGLRPLPSFVYKYFSDGTKIVEEDASSDTYRTNSVWAQNFNQHWAKNIIVSCGPWIFEKMTERQITFRRNPDHYMPLAALVERLEIDLKESPDTIWQDFKAGKIDSHALRPDQLLEWDDFQHSDMYAQQAAVKGNAIQRLDYLSRTYTYIGWNQAKPLFSDKRVRQALTMAIDRKRIIAQTLKGLGLEITGPFFVKSKDYDSSITPWPYDPDQARLMLEEAGWADHLGQGLLDKQMDGKSVPFSFTLTYYVKNPTSLAIGEAVKLTLKDVGIQCNLNGVDIADLSAVFDDKSFDALLLGWVLGTPPEEPRQLWYSAGAKEKGSSNAIGFANAEIDKIIDQLTFEYNPERRLELYHRFDAIIHDEAPYTFLFTPKSVMLYRDYLKNVWIPAERQDLVPGADVAEPIPSIFWIAD